MTTALRILSGIFTALAGLLFHFNYAISGFVFSVLAIFVLFLSLFSHRKEEKAKLDPAFPSNNIRQPTYRTEIKNGIKTIYKFDPLTKTESVESTSLE
jgi:hypothetical protein